MPSVESTLQLLHTIRYLRARQIAGRFRKEFRGLIDGPQRLATRRVPELEGCGWQPRLDFLPPGSQANTAEDVTRGKLTFLNHEQEVGWPPKWHDGCLPKLWHYNLHYFEYLWALDYRRARTLVLDWIKKYPPQRGEAGWEPYPTSLRLVNWCCLFFGRFRRQTDDDTDFREVLWKSIFVQAEWLRRNLEIHLMGNHLFENAAALAATGCCFRGPAARQWYRQAVGILSEEIREQILPDGGHFERSPMYHGRILYLLAMLMNLGDEGLDRLVRVPLQKMREALWKMCHPDGRIALLNDSALGIGNEPGQLAGYAGRLLGCGELQHPWRAGTFALPDTGYYGARSANGDFAICDAGPVGPDYIPGHAHGDIFSFELSLGGHRVIVDSGVYDYLPGQMRSYCRSTRAHNTVEIEGRDQCEFWRAFRVARRGRARDVVWQPSGKGFTLAAWHDGYRRLGGAPRHHREFTWDGRGSFQVKDRISAARKVTTAARLHLHWCCRVARMSPDRVDIVYPAGRFAICFFGDGDLAAEQSLCCPEFGQKKVNTVLAFCSGGSKIETGFRIEW